MDSAEKSEGASVTDDTAMASRGKRIMLQKAVTFDSSALDHKASLSRILCLMQFDSAANC